MRMYFRHWLFHKEQQHCEQSILSILEWTILICSTAYYSLETPSLSFPPSFSSPIFLSSSPCSIFPPLYLLPYISLYYSIPLSSFLPLSLFLFASIFLPSSLSFTPSHPSPSNILPFLYFASLLFSLLKAFYLNPICCMTFLIPVSSSPSLFFPRSFSPSPLLSSLSNSPPSLCFSITHVTTYFNCYYNYMLLLQLFSPGLKCFDRRQR